MAITPDKHSSTRARPFTGTALDVTLRDATAGRPGTGLPTRTLAQSAVNTSTVYLLAPAIHTQVPHFSDAFCNECTFEDGDLVAQEGQLCNCGRLTAHTDE